MDNVLSAVKRFEEKAYAVQKTWLWLNIIWQVAQISTFSRSVWRMHCA